MKRRSFLKSVATAAGSVFAAPLFVPSAVLGRGGQVPPSERVQIGVIGIGVRGKYLIGSLPPEGRVVALCDWYLPRLAEALHPDPAGQWGTMLRNFVERDATTCKTFGDYRRMLDQAQLDAVMITTPDHHHVLAAMRACQAGCDLYVEKPLSLTIAEGRRLVAAVQRSGRVCQVGSQNRSMEMNQYGCRLIREGGIGKVSFVEVGNYPGPLVYENLPPEDPPRNSDWDLFCGPTPQRPYHWRLWLKDERLWQGVAWRGWDMWRSYSGHLMTNWGAHTMDMVQCALGTDDSGPVEVWPMLQSHDGPRRTCPVAIRYASGVELRCVLPARAKWVFHGEKGKAYMSRNRFSTDPPDLMVDPPDFEEQNRIWEGESMVARPHIQNWLDCLKTRRQGIAPVEYGHRTATICHLANIARELGRKLRWDPEAEMFPDDAQANALCDRTRRPGWELPDLNS